MNRTTHSKKILTVIAAIAIIAGAWLLFKHPDVQKIGPAGNTTAPAPESDILPPNTLRYLEVTDGCGPHFEGVCVNVRSGPGVNYPVVTTLRTGIVLQVSDKVIADGHTWYKVVFDEWLRYPERVSGDWYIAGDFARVFTEPVETELAPHAATDTTKRIVVDRSEQMLYAYDGDTLFMKQAVSTGLELTPTPRGTFTVFKKRPSRYMQGPIPEVSDQYYDLPGVPWNLYFTAEGAVIHGAYWHNNFGQPWSHGCVNLPLDQAHKLYDWAVVGMKVTIQD